MAKRENLIDDEPALRTSMFKRAPWKSLYRYLWGAVKRGVFPRDVLALSLQVRGPPEDVAERLSYLPADNIEGLWSNQTNSSQDRSAALDGIR